jgi:asparagine synthase (glutamine-hydrolysing)
MCGIFAYISDENKYNVQEMRNFADKCKHRGPDNTNHIEIDNNSHLIFHRLIINGLSEYGNQPFIKNTSKSTIYVACNGEIYNYKELIKKYDIHVNSHSDCEIIIHLYILLGFEETIKQLDGVFACVIIDVNNETSKKTVYASRDPIGVRPLFIAFNENGDIGLASELKCLSNIFTDIKQFPPATTYCSSRPDGVKKYKPYYSYEYDAKYLPDYYFLGAKPPYNLHNSYIDNIKNTIKIKLCKAMKKRIPIDRKVGCLLSGGFDSSLIASLVCKMSNRKVDTFSVGLKDSEDIKYARIVADYLGTNHHEIILDEEEMLSAIDETIYMVESYDTTTIRASTPMYLLCKYIKKNTDIKVIFSGEGIDEASGSYLYFYNAPSPKEFQTETVRLLKDLQYFDVLRCDKSVSTNGLEVRVPFLDKDFINYYMTIDPYIKMPSTFNIEKYLLRSTFESYLPKEITWRVKEGMSDGVSSKKKSWYEIIQDRVSDMKFTKKYNFNQPMFNEAHYYREIYDKYFPNRGYLIPYYWLPKWSGNTAEPSARVLDIYSVINN